MSCVAVTVTDDGMQVRQPTRSELRAVVIRADGRREDVGLIAAYYRNPIRRTWWRLVGRPLADRRIRRANDRHANQETKG